MFDLESGGISKTLDYASKGDAIIAYSPDGNPGCRGTSAIHLFDLESGKLNRILGDTSKPHAIGFGALAWSSDGTLRACSDAGDLKTSWDATDGRLLLHELAHAGGIRRLAWSADGKTLFSGGLTDREIEEVKSWDVNAGKLRRTRRGVGLTPSPDGTRVANFKPSSILLYDLESGESQGTIVVLPLQRLWH